MSELSRKFALAAGVATVLAWGCTQPAPAPSSATPAATATPNMAGPIGPLPVPSGDDRPPIVVGDGSIDLYIDLINLPRGTWKNVGSGPKAKMVWQHDYSGYTSTPIKHLDINLLSVKKGTTNCTDPNHVYPTTGFTAKVGGKQMTVSLVSGNFQVEFEDPGNNDDFDFWLTVPNGAGLKNIEIVDLGGTKDSCDFYGGHRGIINVRQSVYDTHTAGDTGLPTKQNKKG